MLGVPVCLYPWESSYSPGDAEGLTRRPGHHDNPIPLVQTPYLAAQLVSGHELKANIRGNDNRPAD